MTKNKNMEEYTDKDAEMLLKSGEWIANQADKLIAQYKACKTAHGKNKLIPKMKYLAERLSFEKRQLEKVLND